MGGWVDPVDATGKKTQKKTWHDFDPVSLEWKEINTVDEEGKEMEAGVPTPLQ